MTVVALPSAPSFRAGGFRIISNAARFVSPLTRVGQSVARTGDHWGCEMQLPPLTKAQAATWAGFLASLSGQRQAAYVGPPFSNDLGAVGTPLVNGVGVVGTTLPIDGLPAGKVIPAGAWLCYDTSTFRMLHVTTAEATANGGGAVSLPVMPAVRKSPADNAPVNFTSPTCEMVLEDADATILTLTNSIVYGASISFIEAVRS